MPINNSEYERILNTAATKIESQIGGMFNTGGKYTLGDPPIGGGPIGWDPYQQPMIPGPSQPITVDWPKTKRVPKPAALTKETLTNIIADMLAELKKMSELASRFANANDGPVLVFDPKDGKLKLQDRQGRVYVERELFHYDTVEEIELPDWQDIFGQASKFTYTTGSSTGSSTADQSLFTGEIGKISGGI